MFTILQGYYNWIDQLWEGNMLQSPSQEALTDPIVPILGVLLFLHNEDPSYGHIICKQTQGFSENSICIEGPYIMKPCNSMLLCNQGWIRPRQLVIDVNYKVKS